LFAAGWTEEHVLDNYPTLTPEGLWAVFAFAAELLLKLLDARNFSVEGSFTVVERDRVRQRRLS
jgi:hypothetical protein